MTPYEAERLRKFLLREESRCELPTNLPPEPEQNQEHLKRLREAIRNSSWIRGWVEKRPAE
jgi:hypothetical protein